MIYSKHFSGTFSLLQMACSMCNSHTGVPASFLVAYVEKIPWQGQAENTCGESHLSCFPWPNKCFPLFCTWKQKYLSLALQSVEVPSAMPALFNISILKTVQWAHRNQPAPSHLWLYSYLTYKNAPLSFIDFN